MFKTNYFKKISYSFVLAIIVLAIYSCSRNANSEAKYIFKPAPTPGVAASINGKNISMSKIEEGIKSDLYEAKRKVFDLKMSRIKAILLESYINNDPRKKGLTNDQYLEKYISSNVKISDKEVSNFSKERKIPKKNLTAALKERIKQFLIMNKKKNAVDIWMKKQLAKNKVEIYLKRPARPVFDVNIKGAPFKGNLNAKVSVVEFSDFQCPYCAKGRMLMEELRRKYGTKIKIVYKTFPLPFHNHAQVAAEASLCALRQKVSFFWGLHDKMFDDQQKLDTDSIMNSAKSLGINIKKLKNCMDKHLTKDEVNKNITDGNNAGVKSTPTYFVNGQLISGAQDISVFSDVIDAELAK